MPYFITQDAEGCAGWATVKEDGEVLGCHETKQAAIDQMVALSIAEEIEPGGERNDDGPNAIIVDIDGTLVTFRGQPIDNVIRFVNEYAGDVIIITARLEENRDETIEEMSAIGANWNRLIMKPDADTDSVEFKGAAARDLAASHNVELAIEDDENVRAEYARIGITVLTPQSVDPEELPEMLERQAIISMRCEWDSSPGVVSPDATLFHMENGVETRRVTVNEFEVRDAEEGAGTTFVGLAAAFNAPSEPLPFVERIAPGAFTRSLQSRNEIKLFVNHDTSRVLASKRAGTLRLWESDRGLEVEADLPDTTDGRDMAVLLRRGDVDSMSFGFSVPKGGDVWSDDGQERELREVRLHEVSVVTGWPAYRQTSAAVRSLDGLVDATGLEADKLGEAITKLEAGETLDDDLADVLDQAVTKLRAERDDFAASLAMKQKQLDMLLARV